MGRLASEPEDHAATGQQRRPWCTNVLAAAAVIADVIGDCADTIHVALSASTSDKARYVNQRDDFFSYCPVRYRQTVRSETLRIWAISGAVKPCFFSSSALRGLAFVLPFARPV
jgi:hypothetical protein